MLTRFKEILSNLKLDRPILLAVSGGIDSMCMADLFRQSGANFAVAHCNFCLRGQESDGDEDLVKAWGRASDVVVFTKHFDTEKFARDNGVSIEMAARELRYRWFAELCKVEGFGSVAIAHNADDNVETMILNLLRGTGINGITGIRQVSNIPYSSFCDARIIRPMLNFTREEISAYAKANGVSYREDSSNGTLLYKRNKIRNLVAPVFKEINPSYQLSFSKSAKHFLQVAAIADEYFAQNRDKVHDGAKIDITSLKSLKFSDYILFRLLSPLGFNEAQIDDVHEGIYSEQTLSGKVFVSADGNRIVATNSYLLINPSVAEFEPVLIGGPGVYTVGGRKVVVKLQQRDPSMPLCQPVGTSAFDASALAFPFWLRPWRNGDWIRPLGLGGRKKISDVFTDKKFTIEDKAASVMVVSLVEDQHVIALLGCVIDEGAKIKSETTFAVSLSII